jgi:hypothetical protein
VPQEYMTENSIAVSNYKDQSEQKSAQEADQHEESRRSMSDPDEENFSDDSQEVKFDITREDSKE